MNNNLLDLNPIQKFINGVGRGIASHFGKEPACIIYLQPDGTFYGVALYEWLKKKGKNLTLTTMQDDGRDLEEEKVKGRKVLIVDNDIVTGKGYKRAMEAIRERKERLKIKDIKFAVLCDRTGLADFSVEGYSAYAPWSLEKLDGTDLKIIQELAKDGRRSFIDIARKTGFSQVAVKNRVERMVKEGFLKIQGLLSIEKTYSVSAHIEVEADKDTISKLIDKIRKSPLLYHLVKTSGRYNLLIGILAPNLEAIENFIDKEIRKDPGVKHIEVSVGELPIIPKTWDPPIS